MSNDKIHLFEDFTLDLTRGFVLRGNELVHLRPQTYEVLKYLVENRGRLISKDKLIEDVWHGRAVTDGSLAKCIEELREALGENSMTYVRNVRGRGYIFEAATNGVGEKIEAGSVMSEQVSILRVVVEEEESGGGAATQHREEREIAPPDSLKFLNAVKQNKRLLFFVLACFAIVVIAGFAWSRWFNRQRQTTTADVASPIDSIAVLPFENAVQDPNAEYLSDGITESLINRLSQLSGLKVMSRSSVFRYKGKEQDTNKVGGELNVRAVLTGSVKQIGDQLVITVRLDDAETGQHIWGEQYVRKFTDILAVQSEIAQEVSTNLRLKLTGADERQLAKHYTDNVEAYQLYLKGNYKWNKHTEEDLWKGIEYYNQALEKDPNYALAYFGLSASYGVLGNAYLPPNENFPKAKAYAAKALAIDDTLAEAHTAMGAVRLLYDWDWVETEKEFKRAQTLDPNKGDAHQMYAAYLEAMGRFDEALPEAKRAQELDPLSPMSGMEVGTTFYYGHQYDEAIAQLEKTINLEPRYVETYLYLGQTYEQKKMYAQAIETYQEGMIQAERHPMLIAALGHAYAVAGERDKANKALAELREMSKRKYVSPYLIAVVYAGLGDKDQTFAWLDKAYQDRAFFLIWLKVEPLFDSLRDDARYKDLLRRIGLQP